MKARWLNLFLIAFVVLLTVPQAGAVGAAAPRSALADPLLLTRIGDYRPGNTIVASGTTTSYVYLPFVTVNSFTCSTGQSYGSFPTAGGFDGIPAAQHPDKNLAVRGYVLTTTVGLGVTSMEVGIQSHDPTAPQFPYLFAPPFQVAQGATNVFAHDYQVYSWPWPGKGPLITNPPVTMVGITTTVGTQIHLPVRLPTGTGKVAHYNNTDYYGMVLYADPTRITIVYLSYDSIVIPPGYSGAGNGYGIHIENFCVDPNLLALYTSLNAAGRHSLPGIQYNQAVGVASSSEVDVAIQDSGNFMDPRTWVDWWNP